MNFEERVLNTFPKRLAQARLETDYSQAGLGIKLGMDENIASVRMNQYERGVHIPEVTVAADIAKVLKVPTSFLYEPDDDLAEILELIGKVPKRIRKSLYLDIKKLL